MKRGKFIRRRCLTVLLIIAIAVGNVLNVSCMPLGQKIMAASAEEVEKSDVFAYTVEVSNANNWTLFNYEDGTGSVTLTYTVESYKETGNDSYGYNFGVTATKAPKENFPYVDGNGKMAFSSGKNNAIMKVGYTYSFTISMDGANIVYSGTSTGPDGKKDGITFTTPSYGTGTFSGDATNFGIYIAAESSAKLVNVTCVDAEGKDLGLRSNNNKPIKLVREDDITYTYLSFHDYLTTSKQEAIPMVTDSEAVGMTEHIQTLNKVIFSGKVTFNRAGGELDHTLRIGGVLNGNQTWYGICLYVRENNLYAKNLYTGEEHRIGAITLSDSANISIQFDEYIDGLWTVVYTVNGNSTTAYYSQSNDFGNYIVIYPNGASMRMESSDGNNPIRENKPVSYDLDDGDYLVSGQWEVTDARGQNVTWDANNPVIKNPGDYTFLTKVGSFQYKKRVSLYRVGDVNLDGTAGTDADLEALKGLVNGVTIKYAADCATEYAADLDNDEKVGARDLELMQAIRNSTTTLKDVLAKYHVPAITYDYLGGDEVMPILGHYGPYIDSSSYNFLTDEIYQLIKESGVNLIHGGKQVLVQNDYMYGTLELGEKHGLGYYVDDWSLNPERLEGSEISQEATGTVADIAKKIGRYSYHENYLGTYVADEPFGNKYDINDTENRVKYNRQIKFYDWLANTMNSFTNNIGFINIAASGVDAHHTTTFKDTYDFLDEQCRARVFSYDYYPFARGNSVTGTNLFGFYISSLDTYYESLWQTRKESLEREIPFWAYVEAGGDFRDDSNTDATDKNKLPTEAETYWNINNYLAFGAKGIEWFTLIQPHFFSYEGTGTDPNRNGLIGVDGTPTPYYDYAKNINAHIAAIDDVLMKATSIGIMATGEYTIANLKSGSDYNITTSTTDTKIDMLKSFSGGNSKKHGGILGCFDYRDTEAFYVVNDSVEGTQSFTLEFVDTYNYRCVQNAKEHVDSGSSVTLTLEAGQGALVVLEEERDYYTDEPNAAIELEVTNIKGDGNRLFVSWGATESLTGSAENEKVDFKQYSETIMYLNGTAITPTITEAKEGAVWGLAFDLSPHVLQEGDVIRIGGTIYPTSGDDTRRLISIAPHDYTWSESAGHNYIDHVCLDCGEMEKGYYFVDEYKVEGAETTYPHKENMLFAGWFTDKTCSNAYKERTGVAYARFVDAGILVSLAQIPAETGYQTETPTRMRLVSTVDSDLYKQVGFVIEVEGSTKGASTISTKNVYEKIRATEGGVEFTKKPTDIHENSKYFFTYTITGIPKEDFGTKISVTPYWITLDGTKVIGEQAIKTVNLGIKANLMLNGKEEGGFEEVPW